MHLCFSSSEAPFDGLDGSIELIGLVASLPLPVVTAPAIAYHVKLQSMIVQVLGRTVSLVSDIPGDLAGTASSAPGNRT